MSEFIQQRDFRAVVLVDRTGQGGTEVIFDGVRIPFAKGESEKPVPLFVAEWLFSQGKHKVWTEAGDFTNRFGLRNAPESVINALGPESADCSPITLDLSRPEGWDTTGVDRSDTRFVPINVPSNLTRERQGTTAYTFGGRR